MPTRQKISALRATGRPGFVVNFRHPRTLERASRSLQTRDENVAKQIALDIERLVNSPELWVLEPSSPAFISFEQRALEIFFGQTIERNASVAISPDLRSAMEILSKAGLLKHIGKIEVHSEALANERRLRALAEQQVLRLEREKQDLAEELERYRRLTNRHVKSNLGEAIEKFKKVYPQGHAETTVKRVFFAMDEFAAIVGNETNLGKVTARHLDTWLREYKNHLDGGEVSPVTRQRLKACLGVFFQWATRNCDLVENPMEKIAPIPGLSHAPENIRAFRRLHDLETLLDALTPWPYWRAWVATAVLAGPRWAEQAWLKVSDMFLDEGYLRIASRSSGPRLVGTKTGRERNVPIEKTVLLPILQEHMKKHDGAYPWVFPSTLDASVPREKTLPGLWSGSSAFLDAWKPIAKAGCERVNGNGEHWTYGPAEWRHSFGTALGMCGFSALEIARMMGNSPKIAERHYVAIRAHDAGRRWPFKWV